MAVQNQLEEIRTLLDETSADAVKFDNGTDAAGMRVRKTLSQVAALCKSARSEIQNTRTARKESKD